VICLYEQFARGSGLNHFRVLDLVSVSNHQSPQVTFAGRFIAKRKSSVEPEYPGFREFRPEIVLLPCFHVELYVIRLFFIRKYMSAWFHLYGVVAAILQVGQCLAI
jgi:hypothetical protein